MRTTWVLVAAVIGTVGVPTKITAGPPPPLVEVQAVCTTGITVTTSGFPDGDGWLVIGGEPQRTFTRNTTVTTAWPLSLAGKYDYTVIAVPGDGEVVQGFMDCTETQPTIPLIEPEPPQPPAAAAIETEPVALPQAPAFEPHPIWPGLELAPPW